MIVNGKPFKEFISYERIQQRIKEMAADIELDYANETIHFLSVLNGAFMFTSDLTREIQNDSRINFVKIKSYEGLSSSGKIELALDIQGSVEGHSLLIIEDIIDSGLTLNFLIGHLQKLKPHSIKVASLLLKPDALKYPVNPDYIGFEIPSDFVVGYGLDYDGYGRNLKSILVAAD